MTEIVTGRAWEQGLDRATMEGMFSLRHTIFYERLGWEVDSVEGKEQDSYDELKPTYTVARDPTKYVQGCMRILPTEGPYMLKDTFPMLLRGEEAPERADVWEISRLAVAPTTKTDRCQIHIHRATLDMFEDAFWHARDHGVEHYVVATSVALERMLRRMGMPIRRFGDGKATRIGQTLSVACWIDLDEQCRAAIEGTTIERRAA